MISKIAKHKNRILWLCLLSTVGFIVYTNFVVIESVFFKAFGDIAKTGIILLVWYFSKEMSSQADGEEPVIYAKALVACAVISLIAWGNYGTHTEDADPLYGGGHEVVDFEPTDKQRNEHGWYIFLTLAIPSLVGTSKGLEKRELNKILSVNNE